MRTCSICQRPSGDRTRCSPHRRNPARTAPIRRYVRGVAARLAAWSRPDGDCLVWTGSGYSNGYGKIKVDGRNRPVHIVAWEQERGPVPEGLELDHLCRRRRCIAVPHLEPVTPEENRRRQWRQHDEATGRFLAHGVHR